MKKIKLTQGKFALVDDEDFEFLNRWKWYAQKSHKTFYAVRQKKLRSGKQKTIKMSWLISNKFSDHKDCNGLNNQKKNLRAATHRQNMANRKTFINNLSGFKGVSFHKKNKLWTAYIGYKPKTYLGSFKTKAEAALAYNKAAKKRFGEYAFLNKIERGTK